MKIVNGFEAALKLAEINYGESIIDVGSGHTDHTSFFNLFFKNVYTNEFDGDLSNDNYPGDFLEIEFDRKFDIVYSSNVLEHQRNVGLFIEKCGEICKEGGIICLIVPRHHMHNLISGHITGWSPGLLVYNIVVAGFNCSDAIICSGKEEISIIFRNKRIAECREILQSGVVGSLNMINQYFPIRVEHGSTAEFGSVNWGESYQLQKTNKFSVLSIERRFESLEIRDGEQVIIKQ